MVWASVPGFPKYQVSHRGEVRNARTKRVLATRLIKGYRFANLYAASSPKTVPIARLVLEAFVGPRPPGRTVDHVRPWKPTHDDYRNLRWASASEQNRNRRPAARAPRTPAPEIPGEEFRVVARRDGSAFEDDPMVDVSQLGRVRLRRGKTVIVAARDLRTPRDAGGYPLVTVRGQKRRVHELVATTWLGPCPHGMVINHRDHDKTNAALGNLEFVTPAENAAAAVRAGRYDRSRARPVPVVVEGTAYPSIAAAAAATGLPYHKLRTAHATPANCMPRITASR